MATNPNYNKVIYGNTVLIDLTSDTVTADKMLLGVTSHSKSGAIVTGNIPTKSGSDLTSSGATVTVPSGYYASEVTKSIDDGSVVQNAPVVNTSTGLITASSTVNGGYVESDTKTNTLQLDTQSANTITPTRSQQTAVAANKYTLGAVVVDPIPSNYYTLQEIYPVGSLWATEDSTKTPATELGFGTWTKIAPVNTTWGNLYNSTWDLQSSNLDGLYVYKRTN